MNRKRTLNVLTAALIGSVVTVAGLVASQTQAHAGSDWAGSSWAKSSAAGIKF